MKAPIYTRGFTLIEVLTVIIIISILIGVTYMSFQEVRENARNKALLSSLKETQLALELYKAQNGGYPVPGCGSQNTSPSVYKEFTRDNSCGGDYMPGLVPEFIDELPTRELSNNSNCEIHYYVDLGGASYRLIANQCLEGVTQSSGGITPEDEFARIPRLCVTLGFVSSSAYESFIDDPYFYASPAVGGGYRSCIEASDNPNKY